MISMTMIKEYERTMKDAKKAFMQMLVNEDIIEDMESETFEALQTMMHLYDVSLTLSVEQAKTINEIEWRLDRVIANTEKSPV